MSFKLKPINSFKERTKRLGLDVDSKFDMGDIITNGTKTLLVYNVTSSSENNLYTTSEGIIDYNKCNNEYYLIKKGDEKIKYLISSDVCYPHLIDIANGLKAYPNWFEKQYKKLITKEFNPNN